MSIEQFIQDMAREAGQIQKDAFHKLHVWRSKTGRGDIVTEVDEACEKLIIDRIKAEYPDYPILSEESGATGVEEDRPVWVIDPLDGTRNFMMGIPFFCCSIGLVRKGRTEIGAVYDGVHDEMFFAKRGDGASLNGERIEVSDWDSLEDACVSIAWVRTKSKRRRFLGYIEELSQHTSYFRRFGSAALVACYVACGRMHAYVQGGLSPWDMAAAVLIAEEAGAVVTDFDGQPVDIRDEKIAVVMANPRLHEMLLNDILRKD
jgi:myo-inositol-1(or 4)-monophosphatase